MVFSDTTNNTGIVQQTRFMARVDSTQWPTAKIVNSCNNWLDYIAGYAIGADKRFQWDDTNHTDLPEGNTTLNSGQPTYSFLTDGSGNKIVTLLGVSLFETATGALRALQETDRSEIDPNTFGVTPGNKSAITHYDKIADNVIRLNVNPTESGTLRFYFQRTPSYFAATDTTKPPGFSPLLHRGFVIASAYDAALTLGLDNLQALAAERVLEEQKMIRYFGDRNNDTPQRMSAWEDNR